MQSIDSDALGGSDRFQLLRRLGEGGMGVVYEAFDRERRVKVAVKTLRKLGPDEILRLKTEFRALQDLHQENLVELGELFEEQGRWFFTMELVPGTDLLEHVRVAGPAGAAMAARGSDATPQERSRVTDTLELDLEVTTPSSLRPDLRAAGAPGKVSFDEARLRSAFGQLVRGLEALHAAGKVHLDIKPSNVLVTPEGRVVILDFGLVEELGVPRSDRLIVGTAPYMAPEQAAARPVGPSADWYAVGVILYEALTGSVPFEGTVEHVLAQKQRREPLPPRAVAERVPADLDELCQLLLHRDPARRPGGRELLRRLDASISAEPAAPAASFVGRRRELSVLHRALAAAEKGGTAVVVIAGESGVGKTTLLRKVADEVVREHGALVLAGRCHEREWLPYKAIDRIVDGLCRHLGSLPDRELELLLPPNAALLAEVFPVLRRIGALATSVSAPVQDAAARRDRFFAAFRELLVRLGQRCRLVLTIEDIQWADQDSLLLLREALRSPGPRALVLATLRPGFASPPELPAGERLDLLPLPEDDAFELADELLGSIGAQSHAGAAAIAREAAGHPLFIEAIVRAQQARGAAAEVGGLDQALWSRAEELPPLARELLELLVVAGVPLQQQTAARALEVELPLLAQLAGRLRASQLALSFGALPTDVLEPYHDRITQSVLLHLTPEGRRALHQRLALTFEALHPGHAEALATHWFGAGDSARAAHYAIRAADRAMQALAFDRAADLYRRAIDLAGGAATAELHTQLAEALANAGRGHEAAQAFLAARQDAQPAAQLGLSRRAADQLLRSGHIDEGLEVAQAVLRAVGMQLPQSPRRALARLLWLRARIWLRGMRFRERAEAKLPAAVLARIDVCWTMSVLLGLVDTIRGAVFQAHHLLLALDAGEPFRAARALSAEVAFSSSAGTRVAARTARLIERSRALAKKVGSAYALGWSGATAGFAACFEGRWQSALSLCQEAEVTLHEGVSGVAWEVATVRWFAIWATAYLGELPALQGRVESGLREALQRGDRYAAACHRTGLASLCWLAQDEVATAREQVRAAEEQWPRGDFHVVHWWSMLARGNIELYCGDAATAHGATVARWPALERSLLLRCQLTLIEALHLRGRTALAASAAPGADADALLASAERDAKGIRRERAPWGMPLADLLDAGIARARGDQPNAITLLRRAATGLREVDLGLHHAAACHLLGQLVGGDEGAALCAESARWFASRRVAEPLRLVAMVAPGFGG